MFTGIIATIGEVVALETVAGDVRLTIQAPAFADQSIQLGDSIAINGVCLTVVEIINDQYCFDVSTESIAHSLIGDWDVGSQVNMELAMLATTRMGGHLVSGHVDGIATVLELHQDARSWRMRFAAPDALKKYIAKKGSITINGVSLTVNEIDDNVFDINVIPHTMKVTTLGNLRVDQQVHIEVDLIARYLERLVHASQ